MALEYFPLTYDLSGFKSSIKKKGKKILTWPGEGGQNFQNEIRKCKV